jgi:thiol-disulfide isomerase/thioredoxin
MIWIFFTIILLGIAAYYGYYYFYISSQGSNYGNISNLSTAFDDSSPNTGKMVNIYFFHADWCPHCQKAQPEWNTFKQTYEKNPAVNGYTIQCIDVDCTGDNGGKDGLSGDTQTLIQKYDVQGYPTVKMLKDGKIIDFDANVKSESLTKFVTDMLGSKH